MDDTVLDEVVDQRVDRSHPELLLLQITAANDAAQDVFDHLATILRAQPCDPSLDKVRLLFDASMPPQHRFYSPTSGSEEGEEEAFVVASAPAEELSLFRSNIRPSFQNEAGRLAGAVNVSIIEA